MSVFGDYSNYYDLLYRDKDYQGEVDYIYSLIEKHTDGKDATILELGCGTGKHALLLAEKGLNIHGVDMSADMLDQAKLLIADSPDENRGKVTLAQGDVRNYRTDQRFDVCISLFHVMSYQTKNADLQATFKTAAEHLKPGGIFIFDFWYGPSVLTQKPEARVKRLKDSQIEVMRIAEPVLYINENRVQVNYSISIENMRNGKVKKLHESHNMRYLFLPEIEFLAQAEFNVLEHYGWMKDTTPTSNDWAGVSVLERKS